MTVAELREALAGLRDDVVVVLGCEHDSYSYHETYGSTSLVRIEDGRTAVSLSGRSQWLGRFEAPSVADDD